MEDRVALPGGNYYEYVETLIIVGSLNLDNGNHKFVTSATIEHDDYFGPIHHIALVETKGGEFLPIDDVTIVRTVIENELSTSQGGWEYQVSGWGTTSVDNERFPRELNHATTFIKSDEVCRKDSLQFKNYYF